MSPLISVIIPTYNRSRVLLRAIDSVLAQSFKNFELIVVDDGSTDETSELLAPLIKLNQIKYLKQENAGVSAARNIGARNASGEYITFLDSDDEWLPSKLQEQVRFFESNPSFRIVYGDEVWIRNGRRVNQKAIHKKSGGWIFSECVQQCLIAPSSVMIEKKLFFEMGGFDEKFVVCEDYDLWLKISATFEIGFIANPIIIKHGGHVDQLSTKFFAMDLWRMKAMFGILKTRKLQLEYKSAVIDSMKRRGAILMQGYQKHGNENDYQLVSEMLREVDKL
ncbi:MAG: glycosyltransferase family 2 protein [Alphaproteobacteria bacterium]|nr:MAG: glycosyltransferase family 2 protein [Alphaproteobacteria bacterium]